MSGFPFCSLGTLSHLTPSTCHSAARISLTDLTASLSYSRILTVLATEYSPFFNQYFLEAWSINQTIIELPWKPTPLPPQPFIYFLQTLEEIQEYSWETEPLRSSTVPVLRSQPSILTQTTSPDLPPTMLAPPRYCHYLSGAACTFMAAMPFLRGFPAILCHWIAVYLSKLCVKTISTVLQNCCLCPTVQ